MRRICGAGRWSASGAIPGSLAGQIQEDGFCSAEGVVLMYAPGRRYGMDTGSWHGPGYFIRVVHEDWYPICISG